MTRPCFRFGMSVWVILALAACSKAPYAGEPDPVPRGQYPNVTVEDDRLADALVFSAPVVDRGDATRPMSVSQPGRNTSDRTVHVQYRFEFFEASGKPLRTNLGWRFLTMPKRTEMFFQGSAMETNATDWRLIVRPAQ